MRDEYLANNSKASKVNTFCELFFLFVTYFNLDKLELCKFTTSK